MLVPSAISGRKLPKPDWWDMTYDLVGTHYLLTKSRFSLREDVVCPAQVDNEPFYAQAGGQLLLAARTRRGSMNGGTSKRGWT